MPGSRLKAAVGAPVIWPAAGAAGTKDTKDTKDTKKAKNKMRLICNLLCVRRIPCGDAAGAEAEHARHADVARLAMEVGVIVRTGRTEARRHVGRARLYHVQ